MVIVHDRVPDMEKYPPLPDLILDNVPLIPWAFDMCEAAAILLCLFWFAILVLHKHRFVASTFRLLQRTHSLLISRFILMRRYFVLLGSIFLLRSVCMLITSMSVPGVHLKCSGKVRNSLIILKSFQNLLTCTVFRFSVVPERGFDKP